MEDKTTTTDGDVTNSDASAQSDSTDQVADTTNQVDQKTNDDSKDDSPADKKSEDTGANEDIEWAKKKGLDLTDVADYAAIKRQQDRDFHATKNAEKDAAMQDINTQIADAAEDNQDSATSTKMTQMDHKLYIATNPSNAQYTAKVADLIKETPSLLAVLEAGNFSTLYGMAAAGNNATEVSNARQEGKVEARQEMNQSRSASAPASATKTTSSGVWTNQKLAALSTSEWGAKSSSEQQAIMDEIRG